MAKRLAEAVPGSFPVFVKPNAGLPRADGSGYDITPQLFAMQMKPYRELNLFAAGGCCGTTPEFIQLLNGVFAGCKPGRPAHPHEVGAVHPGELRSRWTASRWWASASTPPAKSGSNRPCGGDMNYVLGTGRQSGRSRGRRSWT